MDLPNPGPQSRASEDTSRFSKIGISPSIGTIGRTLVHGAGGRFRPIFQSDQDMKFARAMALYRQERLDERESRTAQSATNLEYSTALNIKECVFGVQALYLQQLAAEENHIKGVAIIPGSTEIDLEHNKEDLEKVIEALQY